MAEVLSSDKPPCYPRTTATNQHLIFRLIAIIAESLNMQHSSFIVLPEVSPLGCTLMKSDALKD